ncbi:TetR/AcrR family transcriptional regulator [Nocardia sp. NPDC048505]|uniref:TetR/AcrR family transcriptional regulator n=1 Tax=unclassified Nocardia TaxID=2637762 RepID=UPI003405D429
MVVNEIEREQAILDAAVELLLRGGYQKLTMGDVAEAVSLHRGLVYLCFKSKDELVEAAGRRELERYAERWSAALAADPGGGTVASIYRAMVRALRALPLAAAIVARDEAVFGKYLRKPGTLFDRLDDVGTAGFLAGMQEAGAMRADIDATAVAFLLDALTPALRQTFSSTSGPSTDTVVDTLADLLDLGLTPPGGPDLAAGKSYLLDALTRTRAAFSA